MRLDDYLLKHGVKCRETALYLIKNGMVTVNGRMVNYNQLPLEETDKVVVVREEYTDVPEPG